MAMVEALAPTTIAPSRLTHCLFQEDWWLEAVAPGAWRTIVIGSGNDVQARLPFVLTKNPLFASIRQPFLTQTLGPWYRPTGGKTPHALGREHQLAQELVSLLPRHDFFSMNFHHAIENWLPYTWMKFEAVPKVTYVLEKLGTEQELWDGLKDNIRREIKKAETRVEVVRSDDVDLLVEMNRRTFFRQSLDIPYSPAVMRRVDAACAARDARRMYFARDEQQRIHAAIYIAFDDRAAYYLVGGADPVLRTSGAMSLLMWNAILDAAKTSATFNFEGSVIPGIERFLRAFGGEQKTYMNVRRANWKGTLALAARNAFRGVGRVGSR
jgi:lipid II:glycine glycyltransferase (peptidoglycan interpeptide bridge formation enzyme)